MNSNQRRSHCVCMAVNPNKIYRWPFVVQFLTFSSCFFFLLFSSAPVAHCLMPIVSSVSFRYIYIVYVCVFVYLYISVSACVFVSIFLARKLAELLRQKFRDCYFTSHLFLLLLPSAIIIEFLKKCHQNSIFNPINVTYNSQIRSNIKPFRLYGQTKIFSNYFIFILITTRILIVWMISFEWFNYIKSVAVFLENPINIQLNRVS